MVALPDGLFVSAIPELRTLKGPGGDPALKAQVKRLYNNLSILHRITQKRDGLCDVESLTSIASGEKWPSSVRRMTVKIISFVKGATDLVQRTDNMLEHYGTDHGCTRVAEINEIIEFINDRLDVVNTCIQAGSKAGGWPGRKNNDNDASPDDIEAMLQTCQEEENDRQELEDDAVRVNQAKRVRREKRALVQLREKYDCHGLKSLTDVIRVAITIADIIFCTLAILVFTVNGILFLVS